MEIREFKKSLKKQLAGYDENYETVGSENVCLIGAAKAAFAEPM